MGVGSRGGGHGASDTGLPLRYSPFRPIEIVEGFPVIERMYSDDPAGLSVGLANISAEVPQIEANKEKIVRVAQIFKERGVNFAVFPEFSLSGYFWEDEPSCRRYMREAAIENHTSWVERELKPLLDDQFRGIILNNVSNGPGDKFFNRTSSLRAASITSIPGMPTTRYSCLVLRRLTPRAAAMTD